MGAIDSARDSHAIPAVRDMAALGRLGGLAAAGRGARAYQATLSPEERSRRGRAAVAAKYARQSPEERSAAASRAARARWGSRADRPPTMAQDAPPAGGTVREPSRGRKSRQRRSHSRRRVS